jgi:hypothetical protein
MEEKLAITHLLFEGMKKVDESHIEVIFWLS